MDRAALDARVKVYKSDHTSLVQISMTAIGKTRTHIGQAIDACGSVRDCSDDELRQLRDQLHGQLRDSQHLVARIAARLQAILLLVALVFLAWSQPAAAQPSKYFESYSQQNSQRYYPPQDPVEREPPPPQNLQSFSPGAFPYYVAPRLTSDPNIPGATVFLMPDGGIWRINPPAVDGFIPPPIYTPPDRDDIHHYRHRRHRY